jgi:pyrroline-5-carboxylate reductase
MALNKVLVRDCSAPVLKQPKQRFSAIDVTDDNRVSASQKVASIALHPPAIRTVLPQLASALNPGAIVVSLALVITFNELSNLLGGFKHLVRMIPSAPAMLGRRYNPVAYVPVITDAQRHQLKDLFAPLGEHAEVKEDTLELMRF